MKKKIVLIEDDPKTARLVQTILVDDGYDVIHSVDGEEGLEKVRLHAPDLVITDVLLPKKDGYVVLESMKRAPDLREIPVVLLSAIYVSEHDRRRGLEMGADSFLLKPDAFLAKPFRSNQLQEAVKILLGEKRPRDTDASAREQIVVVEPEDRHRKILELRLAEEGYGVTCVSGYADAEDAIHLDVPSLVIVGGPSAVDHVGEIRKEHPDLGILVTVAQDADPDVVALLKAGADDVQVRPFDFGNFLQIVSDVVDRTHLRVSERTLTFQLKRTTADLLDRIAKLESAKRELEQKNEALKSAQAALREQESQRGLVDEVAQVTRATARLLGEIQGQVEFLLGAIDDGDPHRQLVQVMKKNLGRIGDLLDESGRVLGRDVKPYSGQSAD